MDDKDQPSWRRSGGPQVPLVARRHDLEQHQPPHPAHRTPHDSPPGPSRLCWTTKPRAVTSRHGYRRGSCHFAFGVLVDADLVVEASDRGGGRKKGRRRARREISVFRNVDAQETKTVDTRRQKSTRSRHEVDSSRHRRPKQKQRTIRARFFSSGRFGLLSGRQGRFLEAKSCLRPVLHAVRLQMHPLAPSPARPSTGPPGALTRLQTPKRPPPASSRPV